LIHVLHWSAQFVYVSFPGFALILATGYNVGLLQDVTNGISLEKEGNKRTYQEEKNVVCKPCEIALLQGPCHFVPYLVNNLYFDLLLYTKIFSLKV